MMSLDPQPTIAVISNSAWNLAHFRKPIIRSLVDAGYRVVAIAPFDGREADILELGADVAPIELSRGGLSPLTNLGLMQEFARQFRALRPSLILAFTVKPNIWGGIAAGRLRIPIIHNVSGLGTAFIDRPLLKSIVTRLYRMAFARSFRVFFQNAEDRKQFVADEIVDWGRTALLPGSGIDLAEYALAPMPKNKRFRFLFVGRLLKDKGLRELAEASKLLISEGREFDLVAVGGEDPDNRSAVPAELLAQWSAGHLIKMLGRSDDVRSEIAASDCVVLPSYREGMPRVILEASAMGRPVIATDVAGCRQAVDHGTTGLLCAPFDGQALAGAMRTMMDLDRETRVNFGLEGRAKMEAEFSDERVVDQYRKAIADVMASPGAV